MHLNALLDLDLVAVESGDHLTVMLELAAPAASLDRTRAPGSPGGCTNLSSGLVRGLQEADRVRGEGGATVLVISDGHANAGVTDHERLQTVAATARRRGVTVSTLGLGLDYDEALLAAVAAGGAGNAHFAEGADAAGPLVSAEVDGLLEQVVQAASLVVRPTGDVERVQLFNDLPATVVEDGFMVELGDFHAGEQRKLLLEIDVPALPGLGLAEVCALELRWTEVQSLTSHVITVPVHVNVVPGDAAAGRIADPTVVSERAFQQAQKAKRDAAEALRIGDHDAARSYYDAAKIQISAASIGAPAAMAVELDDEAALLQDLSRRVASDDPRRLSKFTEADRHRKMHRRGH